MLAFILFFVIIFLTVSISGKSTDIEKKKSYTNIKISIGIIVILFGLYFAYTNHNGPIIEDTGYTASADGFTIDKYDVTLNVSKDNVVDVTETIYINFYEYGHHGIYKYIPTWLKYTGKNGDTVSRESEISDLKAEGYEFTVEEVSNDKKRIKIGSAYKTLDIGIYKYIITYKYNMGDDPFTGFDEFIFHAYGDFWGTRIKNPTIKVTLPEDYSGEVNFFADKHRKNNINNYVNYSKNGNTITAEVKDNYELTKSLTIDIELPEGYFNTSSNQKMAISIFLTTITLIASIAITLILFNRWKKYGKDPDKEIETVEFYPPEKLDPAQLGYIFNKETGRKLTIALIVSLASKGYIRIDEEGEKKKKKIIITNTNVSDTDIGLRRIKVVSQYDPDSKEISILDKAACKAIKDKYFKDGDEVTIESLTNTITEDSSDVTEFLEEASSLIEKNYFKITEDVIENPKTGNITQTNSNAKKTLEKMSHSERIVYEYIFKDGKESVVLEENKKFYKSFAEVSNFVSSDMQNKINSVESYKEMSKSATLYMINCLIIAIMLYSATMYNNLIYILTIAGLGLIIVVISMILTLITRSKTNYGTKMQAKINGFKNYLNIAEKEQLEDQVNKNPHYFFDILPYAYVLGVSKKWISKFEKLNIPIPKEAGINVSNYDVFDHISDSVYYPPSSSGSGSGSSGCGGGCSSCGGGCSSCGGGGSW